MSSDWECLAAARRGDEVAWRQLVERHHRRLVGLVLLITGCPAAANDVAQETFVRLLEAGPYRPTGTVQGLLSTIAYRLAVKESRWQRRQSDVEALNPSDSSPSPLERILREERDRHVAAAIGSLDDAHRHTLVLRFYGGHSYAEIAELTGVPLGTVKSRIFHAVKSCHRILRDKGIVE